MKSKFSDFSYAFTKLNKMDLLIIAFGLSTIALIIFYKGLGPLGWITKWFNIFKYFIPIMAQTQIDNFCIKSFKMKCNMVIIFIKPITNLSLPIMSTSNLPLKYFRGSLNQKY
jgi:hypothetical protein